MIGREKEIRILQNTLNSNLPQMIAIYGRRRIGKTYLIEKFYKDKKAKVITLTGQTGNMKTQLDNAKKYLHEAINAKNEDISSWSDVFYLLKSHHEKRKNNIKHFVLFIDELPWIATPRSNFISSLGYIWNTYFSHFSNVTFVLCGSSASWMIKNIASNKGELHGRISKKIELQPFTLKESYDFLKSKGFKIDKKQVLEYYLTLGGVAQYLEYLNPTKSYTQNISELLFDVNGILYNEFDMLFPTLFGKSGYHKRIVLLLSKTKSNRLSAKEITKKLHIPNLATTYEILHELYVSGFISEHRFYNQKKRDMLYSFSDPFSYFYLKWVENLDKNTILQNPNYWQNASLSASFNSWRDNAFELVAQKHIIQIKKALGISGVNTDTFYWSKKSDGTLKGTQIDMLIKRADKTVTIVECKYYNKEFNISKEYEENLNNKITTFSEFDKEKNGITLALLTTFGTKKANNVNLHFTDLRQDILFD